MSKLWALKKSLWVFHFSGASCNNCDIEILELLTPRYDVERFGIVLTGSIKHADALLVTGHINKKVVEPLKRVYAQMPSPKVVIGFGACAMTGGIFAEGYNAGGPLDKIIPVNAYIPGCPPKPEAMISAIVKLLNTL